MITQKEEEALIMQARVKAMAYRQPIIDRLDRQTEKGIRKYGDTIEKSGHLKNGTERLEYLAEELTDALVYIEHIKKNGTQIEQLLDEVSKERENYIAELAKVRDTLLDILSHLSPKDVSIWSDITVADPTEISSLVRFIDELHEKDHKKLIKLMAEKIEEN